MIRHIVLWKLKEENKDTNAKIMKESLEALLGKIPGLFSLDVGYNFREDGFDILLFSELEDRKALQRYQNDPEHIKIKEFVKNVTIDRTAFDYELDA